MQWDLAIVAVFGVLWLSGTLGAIGRRIAGTGTDLQGELLREIKQLRDEVQGLKRQNHDIILALDQVNPPSVPGISNAGRSDSSPTVNAERPQQIELGRS